MRRFDLTVDGKERVLHVGYGRCKADGTEASVDVADMGAGQYSVVVDGNQHAVTVTADGDGRFRAVVGGVSLAVSVRDSRALSRRSASPEAAGTHEIRAPMPGKVLAVEVEAGDPVAREQGLVVVEAMKMQNELRSPKDGTVAAVRVRAGDSVSAGETLIVVE